MASTIPKKLRIALSSVKTFFDIVSIRLIWKLVNIMFSAQVMALTQVFYPNMALNKCTNHNSLVTQQIDA